MGWQGGAVVGQKVQQKLTWETVLSLPLKSRKREGSKGCPHFMRTRFRGRLRLVVLSNSDRSEHTQAWGQCLLRLCSQPAYCPILALLSLSCVLIFRCLNFPICKMDLRGLFWKLQSGQHIINAWHNSWLLWLLPPDTELQHVQKRNRTQRAKDVRSRTLKRRKEIPKLLPVSNGVKEMVLGT
jgi:hypothetical protein